MIEMHWVIFKLNDQSFGIDIMKVKEIVPCWDIVKIPDAPDYVEGIIHMRGKIVPIVNLKEKFGMEETEKSDNTRIIVIESEKRGIGFAVDDASEMVSLGVESYESIPEMVGGIDRKYIQGVGKLSDRLLIFLDLEKLMMLPV